MAGNFGYTGGGAPLPGLESVGRLQALARGRHAGTGGLVSDQPVDPLAQSRQKILGGLDSWLNFYNRPEAQTLSQQIMARASGANRPYDQQTINRVAGVGADASSAGLNQQLEQIRQQQAASGMSGGGHGAQRRAMRGHQANVRGSRRDAEIEAARANFGAQVQGQGQHQSYLGQSAANTGAATSALVDYLRNDEVTGDAGGGGSFSALGRGNARQGGSLGFNMGNFSQRQTGGGNANDAGDWRARAQQRDTQRQQADAARDERRQAGQAARAAQGPGGPAYGFVHGNEVPSSYNNPMLGTGAPTPQQLAAMGMPATAPAQQAQQVQQAQQYVSPMFMREPAPVSQQPGAPMPQVPPGWQPPAPTPEPSSGVTRTWDGWQEGSGLAMPQDPGLQPAPAGTASPYVTGGGRGDGFYQPPVQGASPAVQGLPPMKSAAEMYAEADHERQLQANQVNDPGAMDQIAQFAQAALANLQQFGSGFGSDWKQAAGRFDPVQAGPSVEQMAKGDHQFNQAVGAVKSTGTGVRDKLAESISQADEGNDALSQFVKYMWSQVLFPESIKPATYRSTQKKQAPRESKSDWRDDSQFTGNTRLSDYRR